MVMRNTTAIGFLYDVGIRAAIAQESSEDYRQFEGENRSTYSINKMRLDATISTECQ